MLWDKNACFKAALVVILLFSLFNGAAMAQSAGDIQITHIVNGSNVARYSIIEPDSSPADGNWIVLQGGNAIRIPTTSFDYTGDPIDCDIGSAYSGLPFFDMLDINETSYYNVRATPHDFVVPYDTYPVYLENDDVKAVFYGSLEFKNTNLQVALLNLTKLSSKIDFTDSVTIKNTMRSLTLEEIKSAKVAETQMPTNDTGDIQSIDSSSISELGNLDQGYYALVVMDENDPNNLCIVAEAPIIVTKSDMTTTLLEASPIGESQIFYENMQIPETDTQYMYVVAMVPEANYTVDVSIASDGKMSGTSLRFKGLSLDEVINFIPDDVVENTKVHVKGKNIDVRLDKTDMENLTLLKSIAMDELNVSNIAIGVSQATTKTSDVSVAVPTREGMPAGKYIVIAAAIDRSTGNIAAINQTTVYLGGTYTFNLVSGWNLISLPLNVQNNDITSIFPADVRSHIVDIWGWDPNAQDYAYYCPDPNDYFYQYYPAITKIETGKAYWVLLDQPASFTVQGTIPVNAPNSADDLQSGWNFVGPTGLTSIPTSTMYPNVVDIWGWDTNIQDYIYYSPDTSDYFYQYYTKIDNTEPGSGYWVLMP